MESEDTLKEVFDILLEMYAKYRADFSYETAPDEGSIAIAMIIPRLNNHPLKINIKFTGFELRKANNSMDYILQKCITEFDRAIHENIKDLIVYKGEKK